MIENNPTYCHMALRSTALEHIIAHLQMHVKNKIPLKCVLERVINTCVGNLRAGKLYARLYGPHPTIKGALKHHADSLRSERHQGRGVAGRGAHSKRNKLLGPAVRPLHSLQILRGGTNSHRDGGMAH